MFDFYAPEASGSIKVNKEGLGLTRLWQQQIMQFPLVALETSQAIVSQYPTPVSLYEVNYFKIFKNHPFNLTTLVK